MSPVGKTQSFMQLVQTAASIKLVTLSLFWFLFVTEVFTFTAHHTLTDVTRIYLPLTSNYPKKVLLIYTCATEMLSSCMFEFPLRGLMRHSLTDAC